MNKYLLETLLYMQVSCGIIQEKEKELAVRLGDSALLECQAELSKHKAVWRFKDDIIFLGYSLNPSIRNIKKYNIEGNQRNREYFLKINDIDKTDIRSYWCETQTKASTDVIQIKITLVLRTFTTDLTTRGFITTDEKDVTEKGQSQTTHIVYQSTKESDGLTRNEKYILFGMVGVCFILVLLSISCNICINRKCKKTKFSNEHNLINQNRPLPTRPYISENASEYDYIDDETLNMYIDPIHEVDLELPMRITTERESLESSDQPYLDLVDETAVVHPYQSLKVIDKKETSGQYMHMANTPAMLCRINSPEYYYANCLNSVTTGTRQFGFICQMKRSCSWPKVRHKAAKQPMKFYLGSSDDCFETETEMFTRKCLSLDTVYSKNGANIETKTQNIQKFLKGERYS